jgi:hypothetical protein
MPRAFKCNFVLLFCALTACEREAADTDPARVVEEYVLRMQRVHGDPKASRAAYELLWGVAKQNLAERAKRASAVAGRKVAPEEMFAPSRFALRFEPKRYKARVEGDWAVVTMTAEAPAAGHHVVKCVRESGQWRVVIELPPLPAIQRRNDALPEQ